MIPGIFLSHDDFSAASFTSHHKWYIYDGDDSLWPPTLLQYWVTPLPTPSFSSTQITLIPRQTLPLSSQTVASQLLWMRTHANKCVLPRPWCPPPVLPYGILPLFFFEEKQNETKQTFHCSDWFPSVSEFEVLNLCFLPSINRQMYGEGDVEGMYIQLEDVCVTLKSNALECSPEISQNF